VSTMTKVEQVTIPEGYKQTEVGVIPEDWEIESLEKLVGFNNGAAHENEISEFGEYVVVNSKYISTEGRVAKYSNKCLSPTKSGNVLMVMSDVPNGKAIAKCYLVNECDKYTVNQRICSIEPKEIESKFLFYILNRNKYYLSFDDGAKQTNLRRQDVLSCPILVPPKTEQTAIANALSDVDNLIAALETLIAKKSAIKTAAMQQLLTGKKRLPGFANLSEAQGKKQYEGQTETQSHPQPAASAAMEKTHPTPNVHQHSTPTTDTTTNHNTQTARPGYKHTELGEIPEDWEVKLIGELSSSYSGGTPSTGNSSYYGGDIPWITSGDLNKVRINSVSGRITEKGLQNSSAKMVDKGALLFALYGATAGIAAITNCTGAINQAILAIMPNNNCDIEFLFQIFRMRKSYFIETYTQGGQPNFSGSIVKAFAVAIPTTKQEQTAIANVLSDMDAELDALQQRLTKTKTIKQGMMQELLTGKTRLV